MARPLQYQTPEQMQRVVDLYFLACRCHAERAPDLLLGLTDEELLIVDEIRDIHPTVTGLALALDLTRQGLINYEGKPEFIDTVKRAKSRVEAYIEQRLYYQNATGSIFNLKNNFGWKDAVTVAGDADNPLVFKEVRRTIVDPK